MDVPALEAGRNRARHPARVATSISGEARAGIKPGPHRHQRTTDRLRRWAKPISTELQAVGGLPSPARLLRAGVGTRQAPVRLSRRVRLDWSKHVAHRTYHSPVAGRVQAARFVLWLAAPTAAARRPRRIADCIRRPDGKLSGARSWPSSRCAACASSLVKRSSPSARMGGPSGDLASMQCLTVTLTPCGH